MPFQYKMHYIPSQRSLVPACTYNAPEEHLIAVDGKLADLAPRLAKHFIEAEIKHFSCDQFDIAKAWAAGV